MGKEAFEQLLGMHGAPMLVGVKPAVLLSFRKDRFKDFEGLLASYAPCFHCKGITVCRLAEGEAYVLLLFYRARPLARSLKRREARALLERRGYDSAAPLPALIAELARRIGLQKSFPHEIGLFLGYPPGDVAGFIEHRGQQFALAGYWKVYENEEEARALFALYAHCTEEFCGRLAAGQRFEDLVAAV